MAATYVKDLKDELLKVGDVVFKSRHRSPVLIVVGKAGELAEGNSGRDKTMMATPSERTGHEFALIDRVFAVTKAPNSSRGPVVLGRSGGTDITIPEFSISKRHCFFEFELGGIKIIDCGSTNGTLVGDRRLLSGESAVIEDGSRVSLGRFAFVFRTAAGLHAHLKSLVS